MQRQLQLPTPPPHEHPVAQQLRPRVPALGRPPAHYIPMLYEIQQYAEQLSETAAHQWAEQEQQPQQQPRQRQPRQGNSTPAWLRKQQQQPERRQQQKQQQQQTSSKGPSPRDLKLCRRFTLPPTKQGFQASYVKVIARP